MKPSPSKTSKAAGGKKRAREEPAGSAAGTSPPVSLPRPNPNQEWKKSKAKTEDLLALLNSGFLREKEVDIWRAAAGDPYPMEKSPDEIPMFTRFAERGLSLPASDFFKGLLGYYGIEYLNLNPNSIFHTSVFVHFCEAFLGIKLHWTLFRKFFRVKLQPSANNPRVVGEPGSKYEKTSRSSTSRTSLSIPTKIGSRSGFTSPTTTLSCRSQAGSSRSTGHGGTWSRQCRKVSSCPSCWRKSRR
jgi:hypothetical protein